MKNSTKGNSSRMNQKLVKRICQLAIPSILTGISEPIISLTDAYFLGNIDHQSLAGSGLAASIIGIIVWILNSINAGSTSIISGIQGDQHKSERSKLSSQLLFINIIIGVAGCLLGVLFTPLIIQIFGASDTIEIHAVTYGQIRFWALPFIFGFATLTAQLRGIQNTSYAFYATALGALLNVILDYLLIPSLGVAGAAWASFISQFIMFLMLIKLAKKELNLHFFHLKTISIPNELSIRSRDMFIRVLALNSVLYLMQKYLSQIGEKEIAAHVILMNIWLFCSFFLDGIANAVVGIIGEQKKNQESLKAIINHSLVMNVIVAFMISFFLILVLFPNLELIWNNMDPNVLSLINQVRYTFIIGIVLGSLAFTFDGLFIGMKKTKDMRKIMTIASFLFLITTTFSTVNEDMTLLWTSFTCWLSIRGILPFIFLKKGNKNSL